MNKEKIDDARNELSDLINKLSAYTVSQERIVLYLMRILDLFDEAINA